MIYIDRVHLKNIRCFGEVSISFGNGTSAPPWTVILGDNATGKTCLLRSIALGLCDESSAAGLMKESDEGYIRRGSHGDGTITVELRRDRKPREKYVIETTISRVKSRHGYYERLRQKPSRQTSGLRDEVFACAYGAGRGTAGTGDISGYSLINSLYNLFNYSEGLQNPELTLRRLEVKQFQQQILTMLRALTHVNDVTVTQSGLAVDGVWGKRMPLRDLADGYKSTMLWLTDFLGWAVAFHHTLRSTSDIGGIILIDELEQHLHPRWQETVVKDLRTCFPSVQFIVTTHSPLIASSIGSMGGGDAADMLYYLEVTKQGVTSQLLPQVSGERVDQVLASRAFDYIVTGESTINPLLRRASELAEKGATRSAAENKEYSGLKATIARSLILKEQSPVERDLQEDFLAFIQTRTNDLERRTVGNST